MLRLQKYGDNFRQARRAKLTAYDLANMKSRLTEAEVERYTNAITRRIAEEDARLQRTKGKKKGKSSAKHPAKNLKVSTCFLLLPRGGNLFFHPRVTLDNLHVSEAYIF